MQYLSESSTAGVLLDLSGAVILLLAFACLASKLFNRYVAYYGAQSVVLAFAAGTSAAAFHSAELWILAALTLAIKGIAIPVAARRVLVARLALKRLQGKTPHQALFLAERAEGLSAVAMGWALAAAAEAATGTRPPEAAERTRGTALELERLYNHAA